MILGLDHLQEFYLGSTPHPAMFNSTVESSWAVDRRNTRFALTIVACTDGH